MNTCMFSLCSTGTYQQKLCFGNKDEKASVAIMNKWTYNINIKHVIKLDVIM